MTTERVERLRRIRRTHGNDVVSTQAQQDACDVCFLLYLLTAQDRVVQEAWLFANAHGAEAGAQHRARLLDAFADLAQVAEKETP